MYTYVYVCGDEVGVRLPGGASFRDGIRSTQTSRQKAPFFWNSNDNKNQTAVLFAAIYLLR